MHVFASADVTAHPYIAIKYRLVNIYFSPLNGREHVPADHMNRRTAQRHGDQPARFERRRFGRTDAVGAPTLSCGLRYSRKG